MREAQVDQLSSDRASMADQIAAFELKKEEWRRHSKQIENFFQTELKQIRNNFDQQLRDLVEKHKVELQIMDQAMQYKQLTIDEQSEELVNLKTGITQNKFLELKAEVMSNSMSEQDSSQVLSAPYLDKQQRSSLNTIHEMTGAQDSSHKKYEDTIERLKDRVNQLQERLANEPKPADIIMNDLNRDSEKPNSDEVKNRIHSMKLNFELLEQKLEQQQINLPESGRVYVVSGRQHESLPLLSQGSLTARGLTSNNNNNTQPRGSVLGADRSAGQDSLETVADFRGACKSNLIDGTHSSSAFIQITTPRLNSSRQGINRLNQTQNGSDQSGNDERQTEREQLEHLDTEVQNNSSLNGASLRSEASTMQAQQKELQNKQ